MDAAQMNQAMVELQQELIRMRTLQRNNEGVVHGLQAQLAALVPLPVHAAIGPAAAAPVRMMTAKPPVIHTYDGSKNLDEWLLLLRQQERWYAMVADADRLRLAAAYLAGPALAWLESDITVVGGTWVAFEAALRARFQPITSAETARAKMITLVQGSSSVHEYVSSFNTLLAALPNQDAETTLHHFLRGLKPHTREMIRMAGVATLAEAMVRAVRIGNPMPIAGASSSSAMDLSAMDFAAQSEQTELVASITETVLAAMQRSSVRSHGSGAGAYKGGQGASFGDRPRPLRGPPQIDGMTVDQVKAYMDAGKCFYCGVPGHMSRNCPKKAAASASSSGK
jgi:hypothetical protein